MLWRHPKEKTAARHFLPIKQGHKLILMKETIQARHIPINDALGKMGWLKVTNGFICLKKPTYVLTSNLLPCRADRFDAVRFIPSSWALVIAHPLEADEVAPVL